MNLDEIKRRINPAYQDVPGTESYERKWLCDRIDELLAALEGYVTAIDQSARAEMRYKNARENFSDAIYERKAAIKALEAASKAEGAARAAIARVKESK